MHRGSMVGGGWGLIEVGIEGSCVIGRKQLDVAGDGTTWFEAEVGGRMGSSGVLAGKLTVFVTQS